MTAHPHANPSGGHGRTGQPPDVRSACRCLRCADRAAHHGDSGEELDAYIAELISLAPPLTSEQRDKLALLLHDHRRSGVAGIRMAAA